MWKQPQRWDTEDLLAAALLLAEGAGKGEMAVPGLLLATAGMGWGLEDPMASHKLSSMVSRAQTSEFQRYSRFIRSKGTYSTQTLWMLRTHTFVFWYWYSSTGDQWPMWRSLLSPQGAQEQPLWLLISFACQGHTSDGPRIPPSLSSPGLQSHKKCRNNAGQLSQWLLEDGSVLIMCLGDFLWEDEATTSGIT